MQKEHYFQFVILSSVVFIVLICGCARNAASFLETGDQLSARGEIDKAVVQYSKAIKHNPDLADAYYKRGMAYREKGDFAKAKSNKN
jgi:tetratricopeptide (TPR) repeat protein